MGKSLQQRCYGDEAPLRRPTNWLKTYPKLMALFFFFSSIFPTFFLSVHWKTSNLVEQLLEINIQCKYKISQQYWPLLCFTYIAQNQFHVFTCRRESRIYELIFSFESFFYWIFQREINIKWNLLWRVYVLETSETIKALCRAAHIER